MRSLVKTEFTAVTSSNPLDLFSRFVSFIQISSNSLRTYQTALKSFAQFIAGKPITAITREDIINYKAQLAVKKAPNTVNLYLTAVKRFFQWCELEGFAKNVTTGVKNVKTTKLHKKDALTSEQVKSVISNLPDSKNEQYRNKVMFVLTTTLGLRTIEISRLVIGDLRMKNGRQVLYIHGKGHVEKDQFMPVPSELASILHNYIKTLPCRNASAPLFPSFSDRNYGKHLTTRSISGILKAALVNAGYDSPFLTAHSLRHTAATIAIQSGASLDSVKNYMRHSSINTTMIYNHAIQQECNPVARLLEREFLTQWRS